MIEKRGEKKDFDLGVQRKDRKLAHFGCKKPWNWFQFKMINEVYK
jgi:hypothetical protein